jgi:molecular chaperone HscB
MASIPTSAVEREGATWAAGDRVSCWNCGAEHAPNLFCPACNALQPLPERADYFQILDLPRRLVIDPELLQQRYYDLHRRLHPDLYQTGPQAARQASLRNTAALNRAYRSVRDPVDRGLYWLTLQGESLGADNNRVPPDLAGFVFEVQEFLEELHAARDSNGAVQALVGEIVRARAELLERQSALLQQLEENFARWDAGDHDAATLTRELKAILSALAYLGTLLRNVEKELET